MKGTESSHVSSPCPHVPCLSHCRNPTVEGAFVTINEAAFKKSVVIQSPEFALGVPLGGVHSVGFDKYFRACIHHYRVL